MGDREYDARLSVGAAAQMPSRGDRTPELQERRRTPQSFPAAAVTSYQGLEGLVGVRLFERDTHSVVPTEAGTILARQTREILAALDLAIDAAKAAGECPAESLRVGI